MKLTAKGRTWATVAAATLGVAALVATGVAIVLTDTDQAATQCYAQSRTVALTALSTGVPTMAQPAPCAKLSTARQKSIGEALLTELRPRLFKGATGRPTPAYARVMSGLAVPCEVEDASTPGQVFPCVWHAESMGNGVGLSYLVTSEPQGHLFTYFDQGADLQYGGF